MTRRTEQLASTLQRAVQELLIRGLHDPRVSGLITVTHLKVTDDKREATVFVSVLPADRQELTLHGLRAAAPHLRHELGEMLDLRVTPILSFKLDSSLKKQAGVIGALAKVAAERDASPAPEVIAAGDVLPVVEGTPAKDDGGAALAAEAAAAALLAKRGGAKR